MLSAADELLEWENGGRLDTNADDEVPALSVQLNGPQSKVFSSESRFRMNVAGRRSGKTYLANVLLTAKALEKANQRVWYVAPTYRMAKQIIWQELKDLVLGLGYAAGKPNESDLSIPLLNGSQISLRGADNSDSLRGVGLDFVVADEAQDMAPDTWYAVLLPALADRKGGAVLCGTPKGFNWFYELYTYAEPHPEWSVHHSTTLEGGLVPESELNQARELMDERLFKQEFEASFETLGNRVYGQFDRRDNLDPDIGDYGYELFIGMDFNVNPMSAVVAQVVADELHVFDELEMADANTELMCRAISDRYGARAITVCPDPAGRARKTSAAVGQTDFTIIQQAGFVLSAPKMAPSVVDRINEVNSLCCNANGRVRLLVHPRCQSLIKGLEGQTYRDGSNSPDKRGGLDHMVDALGYLVHDQFPLTNIVSGAVKLKGYF